MKLRFSPTSPYVRKVLVVAKELGLESRIERELTNVWAADTNIATTNPLGKVPALTTDEGLVLFDSRVICEYLDSLQDETPLIPRSGAARWPVLRLAAIGEGVLDAAVNIRVETFFRPEEVQYQVWIDRQTSAILRAAALVEAEKECLEGPLNMGHIALACGLSYVDFRQSFIDWRKDQPALSAWFAEMEQRPSLQETLPPQ